MYNKEEYMKEWRKNNKQKYRASNLSWYHKNKERQRHNKLMERYNITLDEWKQLLVSQDGKCGICQHPFRNQKEIHTDHNHTTNKVRGLLCHRCNNGLGLFCEDIDALSKAIEYLKKWNN